MIHHVQLASPVGSEEASRRFHSADPHGNRLELLQPVSEAGTP